MCCVIDIIVAKSQTWENKGLNPRCPFRDKFLSSSCLFRVYDSIFDRRNFSRKFKNSGVVF